MSNKQTPAAVILAAGMGKRMASNQPKALCKVLGKPMINWVIDSCKESGVSPICVVASHEGALPLADDISICYQRERLGTGHGVMMAAEFINSLSCKDIVVLYGDVPFVNAETLSDAFKQHEERGSHLTVITANLEDPARYGRIIRSGEGFRAIIEYADATPEQREIKEINSGIYLFNREMLLKLLPMITPKNAQGEYYLTDTAELALENGYSVDCYRSSNPLVVQGANDRKTLAELNDMAREMVLDRHYHNGVDIPFGSSVMISPDVKIGRDTRIMQGVTLLGDTVIGENVLINQSVTLIDAKIGDNTVIGSATTIENSTIGCGTKISASSMIEGSMVGDNCNIISSMITDSSLGNSVRLGPYSQLRPNSHLADGVKIGNFVEVKNSTIGEKTSVAHLTYIGDSDVGKSCNFGCGVVTVNYDGKGKYRSNIGDDVFIGCNSNLVSPVNLGDGSYIAAATTVTEDVPSKAFSIGRCRQVNKENYDKMPNKK